MDKRNLKFKNVNPQIRGGQVICNDREIEKKKKKKESKHI